MTRHNLRTMLDLLSTEASADPVRRTIEPLLRRALLAFDDTTVIPSADDEDEGPRTVRRAESQPVESSRTSVATRSAAGSARASGAP
jgi:hypothetical protein